MANTLLWWSDQVRYYFYSYGLAWSNTSWSVSMPLLIMRLVFRFWARTNVRGACTLRYCRNTLSGCHSIILPAMPASPIASNYPSTNSGHHWQCMAREHPFEGNYGASQTLWKRTVGNAKRRKRGLCFSPRALANWIKSLTSNSDCCYQQLSVATSLHAYSYQRPLAEKAAGWICKFSAREEWFTRTSQQPLTGSHRRWSYFEQAGTDGTPT